MFYKLSDNDIDGIKYCILGLLFYLLNFVFIFLEYERLHKKEIHHILDTLNRPDKCCELVRLKEKGIVLHQESFNNIFETLALGFEESSDIMAEIMEELIKVNTFTELLSY